MQVLPKYAELVCRSNFSFLHGASHAEELVVRADDLGYSALAVTDECSLAGVVRAHMAARDASFKLLIGSYFCLNDDLRMVLIARHREGYAQLCELITRGRRQAHKGNYLLRRSDLAMDLSGCLAIWLPQWPESMQMQEQCAWMAQRFAGDCWLGLSLLRDGRDRDKLAFAQSIAREQRMPLVAIGDVLMHARSRRALQDVLTAIRHGRPVQALGFQLNQNGERHLRSRADLVQLYPRGLLRESVAIAEQCQFSLDELRYEYPHELVPQALSPQQHLVNLTQQGMAKRWPQGVAQKVRDQVQHELRLIDELDYAPFFLTVEDVVRFARSRGILCQGRGSAANSAVCYCLGITSVDPSKLNLLFERFISKERNEPPDIDVDFEHERREEVIQYIYQKYGRERAALAATVITYRTRSAVRDVAKALGLSVDLAEQLLSSHAWWDKQLFTTEHLREAGLDPDNPLIVRWGWLVDQLKGFPRHLSQHVGGFVISERPLYELVPVENAAMPERSIIQWDKDDLEALGLLKVDCLSLGMLSAIRRAFDLVKQHRRRTWTLANLPPEDPAVYHMLQQADTVGVFQVESRGQMTMLPRLKPQNFYDLVIEVAILRPGPIQGEMVHPYLRRRHGEEAVEYPSEEVRQVLQRTLGVPIFQEQVIQLATVAAGFSAGEADQLRRSMASWKRHGGMTHFEKRLLDGMRERGYSEDFAQRIYQQILGFGSYGFPESHSASFALLVYVSAWLKCHEPAAFTAALINSQPMGFYAPSQLIQDAQRHGVQIRAMDVRYSNWDCTLEENGDDLAIRLGMRLCKGLRQPAADALVTAREAGRTLVVTGLAEIDGVSQRDVEMLAAADALRGLAGNRHQARWQSSGIEASRPLLSSSVEPGTPLLPVPSEGQDVLHDYQRVGVSLRRHPLAILRARLSHWCNADAGVIADIDDGTPVRVAGLVTCRQRPGTATGVVFITLEDEIGFINVIVWASVVEKYRRAILNSRLLAISGIIQREGLVIHLIAHHLEDRSELIGALPKVSRDFH